MIKIISTNGNSQKYGNCEKCKKPTSEVFHVFDDKNPRPEMFGCYECCANVATTYKQQKCSFCDGEGFYYYYDTPTPCDRCDGTGRKIGNTPTSQNVKKEEL